MLCPQLFNRHEWNTSNVAGLAFALRFIHGLLEIGVSLYYKLEYDAERFEYCHNEEK